MQRKRFFDLFCLIAAVCIFGSIGLLRKYIDLPSSFIAFVRAAIGTLFLLIPLLFRRKGLDTAQFKQSAIYLILSGIALGFNWIFLFEAYCYTTVATATLCYYMAPIIVILVSPLLFREKLTCRKLLCVGIALVGIALVSGIFDSASVGGNQLPGVGFGLAAAVLYATVVVLNKKITGLSAMVRTVMQLGISALVLLPYTLLTEDLSGLSFDGNTLFLLVILGVVHTAVAYALYFGSVKKLPAQTVAIFSYIDPVLAIILSAVVLSEPMSLGGYIGSTLIIAAAILCESGK